LRGIEKFEGEIDNFILNTFINFKPVKRFENRSGVSEFFGALTTARAREFWIPVIVVATFL